MARLLLVGWDAADWKVIRPLLDQGEMPYLAGLMRDGVHGNLATIVPPLSPMVWTSIATGKRPYKHGIHGFSEPTEDGLGVRPISNLGRKTKAFWNILNQHGKRSLVVGWWPSHPAEPIRGAMVSNHFPPQRGQKPDAALSPGTVWPPRLAQTLAELRVHPSELTGDILRMFVPDAHLVDQSSDRTLNDLAAIVAETMSIHAAATELIETEPWDLAAVYFCGIDHFSHRFMSYHARKPRRKGDPDPAIFTGIVANGYRYHDLMLGRLMQLAGPDCAVMVLSDHGFHSDRLLPDHIPAEPAGPAHEHRDFGVFALRGPGVRAGQRVYGASVLDIAPTVLHLFGLPAAKDMDGKVLVNAFQDAAAPAPVDSWDDVPGEDGRHAPSRQYDGVASAESLKQLVALGYVAPPGEDARKNVESCVAECRYNLARAWLGGGHPAQAAAIFEELLAADPEDFRYYQNLFHCRMALRDRNGAARVLQSFDRAAEEFAPRAQAELQKRMAETGEARTAENNRDNFLLRRWAEKAGGYVTERLLLRTHLALGGATTAKRKAAVRPMLEHLAKAAGRRHELAYFLADAFATVGDYDLALSYVRRVRRVDPDHWQAIALEARIHLAARRYEEAAARAIDSLALVYIQPMLHCVLGAALAKLGETVRAEQSFRVAIAQMPGLIPAHRQLAALLRKDSSRIGEAAIHLARVEILRKQSAQPRKAAAEVVAPPHAAPATFDRWTAPPAVRSHAVAIVSGLPRSGTSMMMQMLAAAGIEPYSDGKREPDEDNPRGYFEHEHATSLHRDTSWVPQARGKVVKVVATLLPHLPSGENYRIIMMLRNLDEVIASQRAMLARLRRKGGRLTDDSLRRAYSGHLVRVQQWLQSRPEIAVLPVDYAAALADPAAAAARLAEFLGAPFDTAKAAASVVPALRRQGVPALP
jgi:predicted AlkP superfamily phosphohydrolase/phosphomutase/tetratricopeptide (TPR) repeat protein